MTIFNTVISGGGTTPTGTIQITTNGTHDVTNYATADVQVPTTAPAYYIEKSVDANGVLTQGATFINLSQITGVGAYVLSNACRGNTTATGFIDMSRVRTIGGASACINAFNGCTGVTGVDLSSLTTVTGNYGCQGMFQGCTNLTGNIDLSSLTTVSGQYGCQYMFERTGVTGVDLSSLTTVSSQYGCQYMFQNCASLTGVVDLSSLVSATGYTALSYMFFSTNITGAILTNFADAGGSGVCQQMFARCYNITELRFPSLRNISSNTFVGLVFGATQPITIHFPSNLSSSGIQTGIGGTDTTVLFDLPATLILTGADTVTYTRNPKYDTGTALAWKVGAYGTTNFTPAYYTSGLTDPTVGTTIYSDAACTTVVTTVDSIA